MLQPKHRERLGLQGGVMNLNEQGLVMRGCKGCVGSHCNPHSNYFDLGCEEAIETASLESACVCVCVLRRPELKNVGVPADGVLGRITLRDSFLSWDA